MNVTDIVTAPRLCCICREPFAEFPFGANNPDPVTADGACCDSCNKIFVIPAREAQQ